MKEEILKLMEQQERDQHGNEIWTDTATGELVTVDPTTGRDISYGGYSGFDPDLVGPEFDYQSMARGGYTGYDPGLVRYIPPPPPPEPCFDSEGRLTICPPKPDPGSEDITPQEAGWAIRAQQEAHPGGREGWEREQQEINESHRRGVKCLEQIIQEVLHAIVG